MWLNMAYLPLPVGEVQEGEDGGAAGAGADLRVGPLIWEIAVAGGLSRRRTGRGAVGIRIWREGQLIWTEGISGSRTQGSKGNFSRDDILKTIRVNQSAELTVSFQLFLQPADLTWSCFLGQRLYLLWPGGHLEAGTAPCIHHLHGEASKLWHSPNVSQQDTAGSAVPGRTAKYAIRPGVTYVVPILLGTHRELFPSLHQQHTGVTNVSGPVFTQPSRLYENANRPN